MKFQTYQSKLIEDNHQQFLTECERACLKLDDNFQKRTKHGHIINTICLL